MRLNVAIVVLLVALASLLNAWHYSKLAFTSPEQVLFEFKAPDLKGQSHTVADWRGKRLLINFWATWCKPCVTEVPLLTQLQSEWGEQDLQIIGIAIDEPQNVGEFVKSHPVNYPILIAEKDGADLARRLGNDLDVLPFSVLLDREGRVLHRQLGEITREKLLKVLESP